MFVDITEEGSRSGVEVTEPGAKVFCERGGVAGDQRRTAWRRAEVVWTNDVRRSRGLHWGTCEGGSVDAARWGLS